MTGESAAVASPASGPSQPASSPLLKVEDLRVSFRRGGGRLLPVIDAANLTVAPNEAVGIVGESGSGKTMLCRSLLGTLPRHGATIVSGQILFDGANLAPAPERVWRRIRGRQIGYVPQSSLAGLESGPDDPDPACRVDHGRTVDAPPTPTAKRSAC